MLKDLILNNRSYRRFDESKAVSTEILNSLVEMARFSASGSNKQPLKFIVSNDPTANESIFSTLAWAGALKDWQGPVKGERPAAYIIILQDTTISKNPGVDHGIAAQSMLLGAAEAGFGGCMLGAVNRPKLKEFLTLDEKFDILLVIALGKPAETIKLVDLEPGESTNYYRDEASTHFVPKRTLEELIVKKY